MKTGVTNHIKFKRLRRLLGGVPLYAAMGILEGIWQMAIDCADDGVIGKFGNDGIAEYVEWDGDPEKLVEALVQAGWVDLNEDGVAEIHDWIDHAPNYIQERLRKRINRSGTTKKERPGRPRTETVPNCPPESETVRNCPELSGTVRDCPELSQKVGINPTQPNQEQPRTTTLSPSSTVDSSTKAPGADATATPATGGSESERAEHLPNGFRVHDVNGESRKVIEAMGKIRADSGGSAQVKFGPMERGWLSDALVEHSAGEILDAWRWMLTSKHQRAEFLRNRGLVSAKQLLDPAKLPELLDLSHGPDAWQARDGPDAPKRFYLEEHDETTGAGTP